MTAPGGRHQSSWEKTPGILLREQEEEDQEVSTPVNSRQRPGPPPCGEIVFFAVEHDQPYIIDLSMIYRMTFVPPDQQIFTNSPSKDMNLDFVQKSYCLDDSKIRLSRPKPFRILLKLWKVVGNIRPHPYYLLNLFASIVAPTGLLNLTLPPPG